MPIFIKPAVAEVYDFLNAANPSLPVLLTSSNTKLANVRTAAVSGRPDLNSAIEVQATGTDYIGRKTINYRRRSLETLFRGVVVQINKFSSNASAASSVVFTVYNLLQQINQQYGVNLTTDDVADANIVRGSTQENGYYTTTVTVNAKATSLGYTGSFALKWRGDAQDIASMIGVTSLPARRFPGGNDFSGSHATIVNNMAYGIDWSSFITGGQAWNGYPDGCSNVGNGTVAFMDRLIAELNRLYGTTLTGGIDVAPAYRYSQWSMFVADLTTDAGKKSAPLANADYYNRVLVVTIPTAPNSAIDANAGVGTYYVHYNV